MDGINDTTSTIIDPAHESPTKQQEIPEQTDRDASALIIDPQREMTCTVIDGSLDLERDANFTTFVEGKYRCEGHVAGAIGELAKWGAVVSPPGEMEGCEAAGRVGGELELVEMCADGLAASGVVEESLTDKGWLSTYSILATRPGFCCGFF